ncbi:MAG: hypothetical protein IPK66_10455 [Rhodospirillales bacterium]|nr:hypothetical protein [Rhodospirillales bacterium]
MQNSIITRNLMSGVALAALVLGFPAAAVQANELTYWAGDFHNHTTCSDGSTSVRVLIDQSLLTYDLDWMSDSGHGGAYTRDCRFSDPEYDGPATGDGEFWVDTIGASAIKGDYVEDGGIQAMWRWQSIQEFNYPEDFKAHKEIGKVVYQGLETIVPGHEHASTTIIAGQFPKSGAIGNANAMAEFEYLFDRDDDDTSEGGGQGWTGKIPNGAGNDAGGHPKAVKSVEWMQANYPTTSYNVPAHVERQGPFDPNGNAGWNVEHFRDYNNAGPDVSFGFESQPGHQAVGNRGGYTPSRTFGGTYGGTGYYAAKVGGMWDALLGEGRNWWFFASSDWHNRGIFSPFDTATTGDFCPGEYQKSYIYAANPKLTAQKVVDKLRSGNAYSVQGDLIANDLKFQACIYGNCPNERATMGETLTVPAGSDVRVWLYVTDPSGTNHSPYSFPNPSLLQIGINQPLNAPVLDHVDLIAGDVTGKIDPSDANYTNPTNASTKIVATFNDTTWWKVNGDQRVISYVLHNVQKDMYVRARGTNLPYGTPNETDADGNPLADSNADNILCTDAACPAHLDRGDGVKIVNYDVEAWADLWFYTNPIFIKVAGSTVARAAAAKTQG